MLIVFCTLLLHKIKNNQNLKNTLQATFNHMLNVLLTVWLMQQIYKNMWRKKSSKQLNITTRLYCDKNHCQECDGAVWQVLSRGCCLTARVSENGRWPDGGATYCNSQRRHQESPRSLSSADRLLEGGEIVPDVCFGQQEAVGPHGGDPGDLTLHFSLAAAQRDSRSAGECGSQEYEGTGDPGRRALSSPQQPWTGRKWISSPPSVRSGNQRGPALEAATVVGAGYTLSVVQPGAAVQPMRLRLP